MKICTLWQYMHAALLTLLDMHDTKTAKKMLSKVKTHKNTAQEFEVLHKENSLRLALEIHRTTKLCL